MENNGPWTALTPQLWSEPSQMPQYSDFDQMMTAAEAAAAALQQSQRQPPNSPATDASEMDMPQSPVGQMLAAIHQDEGALSPTLHWSPPPRDQAQAAAAPLVYAVNAEPVRK